MLILFWKNYYRRMINDGVDGESDGDDGGGLDLVGKIASENFQSLAEGYMTESANLHKEFWMELREEKPDLRKLNYLGSKVNTAMNNAKDYWNRLQKFTVDAQFLKIYGRFLIDIKNERSGEELIRKYFLSAFVTSYLNIFLCINLGRK